MGNYFRNGVAREGTGGVVLDASLERMPLRSLCLREEERFRGGRGTGYCNMSGCGYVVLLGSLEETATKRLVSDETGCKSEQSRALIHAPEWGSGGGGGEGTSRRRLL